MNIVIGYRFQVSEDRGQISEDRVQRLGSWKAIVRIFVHSFEPLACSLSPLTFCLYPLPTPETIDFLLVDALGAASFQVFIPVKVIGIFLVD